VRLYRALHDARGRSWVRAIPVLEQAVAESPERLPALEGLALVRERQGRLAEAVTLRRKIHEHAHAVGGRTGSARRAGNGHTPDAAAIEAFEKARTTNPSAFRHDLELGVLHLDAGNLDAARAALDRVPATHPEYPMALFKRAQVSVLLKEPDRAERASRRHAAALTRPRES
jgi:tetratricopeptide (TPR) repeat protein